MSLNRKSLSRNESIMRVGVMGWILAVPGQACRLARRLPRT